MFGYPQNNYYSPFATRRTPYGADDVARARYVRALQEQRAARQAYADALAEREVRRLEQQHMQPRGRPYFTGDDDDETYEHDSFGRAYARDPYALARARQQQQRRQEALEAELARSRAYEAERRARTQAQAEAEEQYRQALLQRLFGSDVEENDQQLPPQQSYRKLGRVTPTPGHSPQPTAPELEESSPVHIEVRSAQDSSSRPEPVSTEPLTASVPAPAEPSAQSPALSSIAAITDAAAQLRQAFSMPQDLEFVVDPSNPASHKLSYSSSNLPVRAYEHELSKLLEQLDGVESRGINEIREARRNAVKAIELALQELEGRVEGEWNKRQSPSPVAVLESPVLVTADLAVEESSHDETVAMDEADLTAAEADVPMATESDDEREDLVVIPDDFTVQPAESATSAPVSESVSAVLPAPTPTPTPEEPEPAAPAPEQLLTPFADLSLPLDGEAGQLVGRESSEGVDDTDFDIVDRPEL